MSDNPPLYPRVGCGLLVGALFAVLVTCLVIWYAAMVAIESTMTLHYYGLEAYGKYFDRFTTQEYQRNAGIVLCLIFGSMISLPVIATLEAKQFLLWLKRR